MNPVLSAWNEASRETAISALISCCAARSWAEQMASMRPFRDEQTLFSAADEVWSTMKEPDWMQAFRAHPRIGERRAAHVSAQSKEWSRGEQAAVEAAQSDILARLTACNEHYEDLFGFTYIVCATGKSAKEMLDILNRRLLSHREAELIEAAEQQRQIMQIRLRKWLLP